MSALAEWLARSIRARRFNFSGTTSAYLLLAFLICGLGHAAESGDFLFKQFQTDAGLPENTVTAMAQTPDGYIWCATFSGIARFDGIRFQVFDPANTPDLPTDRWVNVGASRNGSLILRSEFGDIFIHEDGKFKRRTLQKNRNNGYADDAEGRIWSLYVDAPKPIWQCLNGDGTNMFEGDLDVRTITRPIGHWVGPGGRVFYAEPPVIRKSIGNGWGDLDFFGGQEKVTRLFAQQSCAYIGTDKALYRFDGKAPGRRLPLQDQTGLADAIEDGRGGVWAAHYSGRLFHCDLADGSSTEVKGFPGGGGIRQLLVDHEGNLWLAMDTQGLVQVRRKAMRAFGVKDGLSTATLRGIAEDREGNMWICGLNALYALTGDRIETVVQPSNEFLPWNATQGEGNEIWVGTYSVGITRFTQSRNASPGPIWHVGMGDPNFNFLLTDSKGAIWFGNAVGLYRYVEGEPELMPLPPKKAVDIRVAVEGKNGAMYAGSNGRGFFASEGDLKNWKQFGRADGLESEQVYSLHADKNGIVWIGMSGGGLARYDGQRIVSLQKLLPELPRTVSGMQSDDFGYLWVASTLGVFRVRISELNGVADGKADSATIFHYGVRDGMPTAACTQGIQPSVAKTRDGRIWFATMNGLVVFDPRQIPVNKLPPPIVIEKVLSRKTAVDLTMALPDQQLNESELLASETAGARRIIAKPGTDPIEFEFAGLSFAPAENVQFRYRLEPLEGKWNTTSERKAVYQRLPPGEYTFRLMARNGDGVWNKHGAALSIVQLPFFWETLSFKFAVVLTLGLMIYAAYRYRVAQLQKVGQLRARIAADLHDEIGSNMGAVVLNSDLLKTSESLSESEREQVADIHRVAQNTAQAIREISWFINPDFDFSDEMIVRMKEIAGRLAKNHQVSFKAPKTAPKIRLPLEFRRNVMAIYKEALNNVARHSNAKRVDVAVNLYSGRLELEIRDDGCGFDESMKNCGQGLGNLRRRARDLNADLQINSCPGKGTSVKIKVGI